MQSDSEVLVEALEEVQRILAAHAALDRKRVRDDVLSMIEFVVCDPAVKKATTRQKMRSRLRLVV